MPDNRRQFMAKAIATAASINLGMYGSAVMAADGYELIDPPQNTNSDQNVEVVEFFWLGCPHCYAFEPAIAAWERTRPANVTFAREAPPLNPAWEDHSRSFYAAQLMGQEQVFVNAMFKAIHENNQPMRKPADIADLAESIGLEKTGFLKAMQSFAVQTKLNRSIQLAKSAGISGVPAIVINGKYRTGARLAGGNARMVKVIEKTVAIERQIMGLD